MLHSLITQSTNLSASWPILYQSLFFFKAEELCLPQSRPPSHALLPCSTISRFHSNTWPLTSHPLLSCHLIFLLFFKARLYTWLLQLFTLQSTPVWLLSILFLCHSAATLIAILQNRTVLWFHLIWFSWAFKSANYSFILEKLSFWGFYETTFSPSPT